MAQDWKQPMNINISWSQPWPGIQHRDAHWIEQMDDVQLEMIVQDLLFDEEDTRLASEMLNRIGIQT